jgi:starch synthase (maltosyl-transferring)
VLAATLVPSYGLYSGYELYENQPASPDNEEYLHSEKYEIKARDWGSPGSLAAYVTRLNDVRHRHPAFAELRNLVFHPTANDMLLAYSKHTEGHADVMLMVVNLDPYGVQSDVLHLDLGQLGLPPDRPYVAHDEVTGATYTWTGPNPYVRLDPVVEPAHVLHLRAAP